MRAKHALLLALVLVAAAAAYGVTRRLACRADGVEIDKLQDVAYLSGALGLSPAQADKIRALHGELGSNLTACCARHCEARARLAQVLTNDADEATLERCLDDMSAAYKDSERSTAQHIRQVRAALTPAQRRRFDDMLSGCLCRPCDMPAGSAGAPPGPGAGK
jgi:hypothetical protein